MDNAIVVTGGAGFIGSNFILQWIAQEGTPVLNLDKLTYAGNPRNLEHVSSDERYSFHHGDICDRDLVRGLLERSRPRAIVHFAAESHVDRSIRGPDDFIRTNVNGTFCLLEEARAYWTQLPEQDRAQFRFLHVSTDEVYGSLGPDDPPFSESTPYAPNSPYSASKAGSDHLVRAYHHTYGLPTLTTNCSNNYGPYQFPEKLIPLVILNARSGKPLPVYGDGLNVRNIEIVETICSILDEICKDDPVVPHRNLITFVKDRPGHDRRYAMDARKIERDLGWKPRETFESGIRKTVRWYLENDPWVKEVTAGSYRHWIATHYS